jgi:outer membrane protein assembly factor BamA
MQNIVRYSFLLLVAMFGYVSVPAQSPGTENLFVPGVGNLNPTITDGQLSSRPIFVVRNIIVTGNKKTREEIILREIPFKSGEQYPLQELVNKFEEARKQLMNMALFNEVVVALKSFEGYNVDVLVSVKERWYIFPVPYFKPVDRNLNQWLVEQNASLDRVNYGLKLLYYNATGRNDKLKFYLLSGYTRQFSFSYDRLYIDKQMKWGMNVGFATGKNREINYNTIGDKQVFLKDNGYVRNFLTTNLELTYRRAIKTRHRFGIGFTREVVKDTILALNPTYFKSGRKSIQFPEIYYSMTYSDVDYIPYPTKGYAFDILAGKKGFNNIINVWQLQIKGFGSWYVWPKTFFSVKTFEAIKAPFKQPYFNLRFLGYSEVYLQGYEYYVIDGVAGGYIKPSLTRELLNFTVKTPPRKKHESFKIPVHIYGKIYGNAGYVYNPQPGENSLSNKMLYSGGIGLDIITFYDFTLKFEWSFNQLGQNGLFLHNKSIF